MKSVLKKCCAALLAAVTIIFSFASCTIKKAYEGAPEGMRPCNEGEIGAIMYVPSNWNVDTSTGIPSAYYSDKDKSMITLTTVPASELEGKTIPEYWNSCRSSFESTVKDFRIIKDSEDAPDYTTRLIADNRCSLYRYNYAFKLTGLDGGETEYCFSQAFFTHPENGVLYIITYSAPASVYSEHLDDLTMVYDNFRLVDTTIPMEDKTPPPSFTEVEGTPQGYRALTGEHIDYILFIPENWTPLMNTGMTAAADSNNPAVTCNISVFEANGKNYDVFFDGYQTDLKATFGNLSFENEEQKYTETKLDGYDCRNYIYKIARNNVEYTYNQYVLIKDGYIYLLTFCCKSVDYDASKPVFDGIASNFRYKD